LPCDQVVAHHHQGRHASHRVENWHARAHADRVIPKPAILSWEYRLLSSADALCDEAVVDRGDQS
jgi:hypothetical protein